MEKKEKAKNDKDIEPQVDFGLDYIQDFVGDLDETDRLIVELLQQEFVDSTSTQKKMKTARSHWRDYCKHVQEQGKLQLMEEVRKIEGNKSSNSVQSINGKTKTCSVELLDSVIDFFLEHRSRKVKYVTDQATKYFNKMLETDFGYKLLPAQVEGTLLDYVIRRANYLRSIQRVDGEQFDTKQVHPLMDFDFLHLMEHFPYHHEKRNMFGGFLCIGLRCGARLASLISICWEDLTWHSCNEGQDMKSLSIRLRNLKGEKNEYHDVTFRAKMDNMMQPIYWLNQMSIQYRKGKSLSATDDLKGLLFPIATMSELLYQANIAAGYPKLWFSCHRFDFYFAFHSVL